MAPPPPFHICALLLHATGYHHAWRAPPCACRRDHRQTVDQCQLPRVPGALLVAFGLAHVDRPSAKKARFATSATRPILSWENWLYTLARWPYIARGICSAVVHRLLLSTTTFRVTPKGTGRLEPLPVRLMIPYVIVSSGSAAAALFGESTNNAVGYVFLSIIAAFGYSMFCIAVPHFMRQRQHGSARCQWAGPYGRQACCHSSLDT